jgi:acetoin utilization protein AcuB
MNRGVVTIEEGATGRDALDRMGQARVRHLPVVSRTGEVIGIITDRDLRHWLFAPDVYCRVGRVPAAALLREAPVTDVMSAPVCSISPDADVTEAAARMREARVGSLVAVDHGQAVGILTEVDVLRHLIEAEATACPELDVVVSYP